MSIPFFSIDMSSVDWKAYSTGLLMPKGSADSFVNGFTQILQKRFEHHSIILLPSARLGFYLVLKQAFKPGDEIIFSAMSFPLYIKIAIQLGLRPILVDVEPEHLNIDLEKIEKAITKKTRGIVATNLFGHPADLTGLRKISESYGIPIIEDCAQSFDSTYHGVETGTESWVGLISCSLMKVPTTLGGGILITKDQMLAEEITSSLVENYNTGTPSRFFSYHLKGFISILNSYPWLYSSLSHQIFGLIKKRNPSLLRQILYSGMGMGEQVFDPQERPPLATYQNAVGNSQFSRTREMTEKRRKYSSLFDEYFEGHPNIKVLKEERGIFWNYQYHVVDVGDELDRVFSHMFSKGVHAMKEDVWDCTAYNFLGLGGAQCPIAKDRNRGLLRLPNNSFLSNAQIKIIAHTLLSAFN